MIQLFENFIRDKILSKEYKDKIFIAPVFMNEYSWKQEDFYITLVKDVVIDNSSNKYWPISDCFTVMKTGEITSPAGWGLDYTLERLKKIDFMTAQEFYNKYPKLCEKLYLQVVDILEKKQCGDWYCKMLKNYERVLSEVKELEYVNMAKKYNL